MIDHDQLFKQLISTFFIEFLELFFPEVVAYMDTSSVEFLDKELFTDVIKGDEYEADLVVKTRFRETGAFFLIHNENQEEQQSWFGKRMFLYFSFLYWKHQLPVYPIAVLSFDTPQKAQPETFEVMFPDLTVMKFHYRVVQLNRLNWQDFVNRPNPVAAALMAKMKIAKADRPRVKAQCLRLLVTLKLDRARMRLISGFVDTYLNLKPEERTAFEREVGTYEPDEKEKVMELTTSWKEEGIQQGLQQGLGQGLERGEKLFALKLLRRRFGDLPVWMVKCIEGLTLERIEQLGDVLLDFQALADLEIWLRTTSEAPILPDVSSVEGFKEG